MSRKILRLPEVISLTGLSRTTIYEYVSRGIFPAQIRLGPRTIGWFEAEVEEWLMQRAAERIMPRAVA